MENRLNWYTSNVISTLHYPLFHSTIWIRKDPIQYIITVLSIIYTGHDSTDHRS